MDAHVGAKDLDLQYMKARTSPYVYAYWYLCYYSAIQLAFSPITQNLLFICQSCYLRVNNLTVDSRRRIYQWIWRN
jgi:hypothetical protein